MDSNDTVKNELYRQYEDSLWKLVMYRYAEIEGERFVVENKALKLEKMFMPSQQAVRKYTEKLSAAARQEKLRGFIKKAQPALNKAAVFIAVSALVFSIAFTNISAFRREVLNLVIKFEEKYALIKLDESENDKPRLYVSWRNTYVPTYIPDGYYIYNFTNTDDLKILEYTDDEDNHIIFCDMSASLENAIDTENASLIKEITVGAGKGLLVEKEGRVTIAWSDNDRVFTLHTYLSVEETIKIAESVTYMN